MLRWAIGDIQESVIVRNSATYMPYYYAANYQTDKINYNELLP